MLSSRTWISRKLSWVIDLARRLDDPLGHHVFIEHGQLDRHLREVLELALGLVDLVAVLDVQVNQNVPVKPVKRDHKQQPDVDRH